MQEFPEKFQSRLQNLQRSLKSDDSKYMGVEAKLLLHILDLFPVLQLTWQAVMSA